jgi:cysteine desulfurase
MFNLFSAPKRIYLDNAAATPVHPEVVRAMQPFLTANFGNPSAIHAEGVKARLAVDDARQTVATVLGIRPEGVLFTGSGTESNNLALLGYIKQLHRTEGVPYTEMEILTTKIEHPSITELLPVVMATGVTVSYIEVDERGRLTVEALERALSPKTVLVTFAYANSEVGVVQSVHKLVRTIRQYEKKNQQKIKVHVDAAQAPLWLPCQLSRLGVDMLSLDAGKCNGPKGVGVLALWGEVPLLSITYGGGQERGLRPGTENVAGIVGMAVALKRAQAHFETRAKAVAEVRDLFIAKLQEAIPTAMLNGPVGEERLANSINISIPHFDSEYAVVYLDSKGIAASTKSACAGAGGGASTVVLAMTGDQARARSTIRFSLSEETGPEVVPKVIAALQSFMALMSPLTK